MRYPERHRHHSLFRTIILLVAATLFIAGLKGAVQRFEKLKSQTRPAAQSIIESSPTPSNGPIATATLRVVDALTNQPLTGQSVAFVVSTDCPASEPCPAETPSVFVADDQGQLIVPQDLLRRKPKLYAAGYKLDSYFAFLDEAKPDLVTVYHPVGQAKSSYDLTHEPILIGLSPAP